jgi:hypothetical protein
MALAAAAVAGGVRHARVIGLSVKLNGVSQKPTEENQYTQLGATARVVFYQVGHRCVGFKALLACG